MAHKLSEELTKFGVIPSKSDPCVFYTGQGEDILLIAVYVDDILAASRNLGMINKLLERLSKTFEIKSLGDVNYCLGIEFSQNLDGIFMNQRGYVNDILDRFGMSNSKPTATPIDLGTKLKRGKVGKNVEEKYPYRELIGVLIYLATFTRPDIAYVVSYLSQYNTCYDETHWSAAKRVLRYLKGCSSVGLMYKRTSEPLTGYVDAD